MVKGLEGDEEGIVNGIYMLWGDEMTSTRQRMSMATISVIKRHVIHQPTAGNS